MRETKHERAFLLGRLDLCMQDIALHQGEIVMIQMFFEKILG